MGTAPGSGLRAAVVLGTLPAPLEGGTGPHVTGWTILESLALAGHQVTLGVWQRPNLPPKEQALIAERQQPIRDLGMDIAFLPDVRVPRVRPSRIRGVGAVRGALDLARVTLSPDMADYYPRVAQQRTLAHFLDKAKPDAIVGYAMGAIAGVYGMATAPRMAVSVDLPHLVTRYRWETTPRSERRRWLRGALSVYASRWQRDYTIRLLNACDAVVEMAAHHADWLRANGVAHTQYLSKPTHDIPGPGWREERDKTPRPTKPRVTLVGNLLGAATRPGLYVLAKDVIPRLEQRFGPDGFEVHIVGKYAPPDDLSDALNRPSVHVLGYVEDVRPEFYQADVLLVPTPIELGTRTRIIVGASFGCCTVAHAANILGIPEFRHGQDILVGSSGPELADLTLRALEDSALQRRLGDAARVTFEEHFSLRTAGSRLVEAVERMVAQGRSRTESATVARLNQAARGA